MFVCFVIHVYTMRTLLKRLLSLVTDHLKIMHCVFYNNSFSELLTQKAKHPTHKSNSFFVSYLILLVIIVLDLKLDQTVVIHVRLLNMKCIFSSHKL